MSIEAWAIVATATGSGARATDDPLFPWASGEVLALLPPDASPHERAAAVAVAAQLTHYADGDRSTITDFSEREGYLYLQARDESFTARHPYIDAMPVRGLRSIEQAPGEARSRFEFEIVPYNER